MTNPRILIIGAGFGGVFAAKKLLQLLGDSAEITLVNKTPHFEYHAQLYKVLNEGSPLQACIPLRSIFAKSKIVLIQDEITSVDFANKKAFGIAHPEYNFDYAIIGLGSENSYYNISGLSKYTYSFRSINEALALSRHIHEVIEEAAHNPQPHQGEIEISVIGGGPAGVEIAGELAEHTQLVALRHGLDPKIIKINLIEAMDHIMPMLSPENAHKIKQRLNTLGVEVMEKTKIKEGIPHGIITEEGTIRSNTIIWVAGAAANHKYKEWGLPVEKNGRVTVNEYLQPVGDNFQSIFIVGDGAQVAGAGQAWPAISLGETAAQNIFSFLSDKPLQKYTPPASAMFLPVGREWAMASVNNRFYWGILGNLIREYHNLKFYFKLLPFSQAWSALRSETELCHACQICLHNEKQKLI
jgi:NADH:ubiquinone reductase (H+-translocating)